MSEDGSAYMDKRRDAYYDFFSFASEFASSDFPAEFDTPEAEKGFTALYEGLLYHGRTDREARYISYIAIADAITDAYQGELLREYYDYDEEG